MKLVWSSPILAVVLLMAGCATHFARPERSPDHPAEAGAVEVPFAPPANPIMSHARMLPGKAESAASPAMGHGGHGMPGHSMPDHAHHQMGPKAV